MLNLGQSLWVTLEDKGLQLGGCANQWSMSVLLFSFYFIQTGRAIVGGPIQEGVHTNGGPFKQLGSFK